MEIWRRTWGLICWDVPLRISLELTPELSTTPNALYVSPPLSQAFLLKSRGWQFCILSLPSFRSLHQTLLVTFAKEQAIKSFSQYEHILSKSSSKAGYMAYEYVSQNWAPFHTHQPRSDSFFFLVLPAIMGRVSSSLDCPIHSCPPTRHSCRIPSPCKLVQLDSRARGNQGLPCLRTSTRDDQWKPFRTKNCLLSIEFVLAIEIVI